MKKSRIYSGISTLALLLLALVVSACGDSTSTTTSPSNAVAATATSAPATTVPATTVTTQPAPTTVATTQAVPTATATSQPTPKPTTATPQTNPPTSKPTTAAPTTIPATKPATKTTQPSSKVNDADKAIELLANQLTQDKIYTKTALNCLGFSLDKESQTYFDLDLREKHGNGCPGDPNTAPIVDRFRVYRATGAIQWYDLISDQYLAYEQYKVSRQGQ